MITKCLKAILQGKPERREECELSGGLQNRMLDIIESIMTLLRATDSVVQKQFQQEPS